MKFLIFLLTSLMYIVYPIRMSIEVFSDNDEYYKCITAILTDIPVKKDVTKFYLNKSNIDLKFSSTVMSSLSSEGAVYLSSFENRKVNLVSLVINERLCMATINMDTELPFIIKKLYQVVNHLKCIIFITYEHSNMIQHLNNVTSQIWKNGVEKNILFIAPSDDQNTSNKVAVYSSPSYATGFCNSKQLIQVGYCESGQIFKHTEQWFPDDNNLGNCKIHAIVYHPFRPYVENRSNNPKGFVGTFMNEMSRIMNFRVEYSWPTEWTEFVKHTEIGELNIAFDMAPLTGIPPANTIFRIATVKVGYVAEITDKIPIWRRLDDPLDKQSWMTILIMFFFIAVFDFLSRSCDVIEVILKVFEVLVGVGVSKFPSGLSWEIFNWTFQLRSLIIQQAYLAGLTDNLTVPIKIPYLEKVSDLLKNNYTISCDHITKTYNTIGKNSWFYKKCIPSNFTNYYNNVFPSIIESGKLNKTSLLLNSDIILANNLRNIYQVQHSVYAQYVRAHRGVLFISEMEKIWRRMGEGGIPDFLHRINVNYVPTVKYNYSDYVDDKLMGSIELLQYGCLIGFVVLIIEILIHKILNSFIGSLVSKCLNKYNINIM